MGRLELLKTYELSFCAQSKMNTFKDLLEEVPRYL